MSVQCEVQCDEESNLVPRHVEGKQNGFEAVLLLHHVVLVRRPHVELAQIGHGAVGPSRDILED